MAQPSFRAVGTEYQGSGGATSHALPSPTALADDVLLAVLSWGGSGAITGVGSPPAGEGWTPLPGGHATNAGHFDVSNIGGTTAMRMAIFYKTSDGSEPASHTFTTNGSFSGQGRIYSYQDVDPADIFGGISTSWSSTEAGTPTGIAFGSLASLTTDHTIIRIGFAHTSTTAPTYTPPADHVLRGTANTSGSVAKRGNALMDKPVSVAGTEAATELGLSGTVNATVGVGFVLNGESAPSGEVSTLLPDGVAFQSGYANATTENITRLHGDPDVSGGLGFLALTTSCPSGLTVGEMRDLVVADISECTVDGMRGTTFSDLTTTTFAALASTTFEEIRAL